MTNPHTQASDEADLLLCPFCGGAPEPARRAEPYIIELVRCRECLAEAEAHVWNTRADLDALRKENERLRYLLWHGWYEMNAIRARSGVPLDLDGTRQCIDEGYWSQTVDAMADALGDDAMPWPPKPTPHGAVTPETKGEA